MNLSEHLGTTLAGDCIRGDFPRVERHMDALNAKLDHLETRMTHELTLVKRMLGIALGGVVALVLKAFFPM